MAVESEKIQTSVNLGIYSNIFTTYTEGTPSKYTLDIIKMVLKKGRAERQIKIWLDKIKLFPEKKTVYIQLIKDLIDYEITQK